jgi:hypothetical protein
MQVASVSKVPPSPNNTPKTAPTQAPQPPSPPAPKPPSPQPPQPPHPPRTPIPKPPTPQPPSPPHLGHERAPRRQELGGQPQGLQHQHRLGVCLAGPRATHLWGLVWSFGEGGSGHVRGRELGAPSAPARRSGVQDGGRRPLPTPAPQCRGRGGQSPARPAAFPRNAQPPTPTRAQANMRNTRKRTAQPQKQPNNKAPPQSSQPPTDQTNKSPPPPTFGAPSLSTTSKSDPPASRFIAARAAGVVMSPTMDRHPRTGFMGARSTPRMREERGMALAATCIHPPGAAQRSSTARAPDRKLCLRLSWISLNAARERKLRGGGGAGRGGVGWRRRGALACGGGASRGGARGRRRRGRGCAVGARAGARCLPRALLRGAGVPPLKQLLLPVPADKRGSGAAPPARGVPRAHPCSFARW